jgi:hypothetical protein
MTTEELFQEYLEQLTVAERRAYYKQGFAKLRQSEDFKKWCKWQVIAKDLKKGKRKMRRIANE